MLKCREPSTVPRALASTLDKNVLRRTFTQPTGPIQIPGNGSARVGPIIEPDVGKPENQKSNTDHVPKEPIEDRNEDKVKPEQDPEESDHPKNLMLSKYVPTTK